DYYCSLYMGYGISLF
nr:immunoglobulin light chain junction region [Macaca mulatta]